MSLSSIGYTMDPLVRYYCYYRTCCYSGLLVPVSLLFTHDWFTVCLISNGEYEFCVHDDYDDDFCYI